MDAGRDLDAAVARDVLQLQVLFDGTDYVLIDAKSRATIESVPEYSQNPAAGARLRAELQEWGFKVTVEDLPVGVLATVESVAELGKPPGRAEAATAELALCLAAMHAAGVQ